MRFLPFIFQFLQAMLLQLPFMHRVSVLFVFQPTWTTTDAT